MKLFSAAEAKNSVKKAKRNSYNYQIDYILRSIKSAASIGLDYLILDNSHIVLYEEDYKTLEKLGYDVHRHEQSSIHYKFGVIKW